MTEKKEQPTTVTDPAPPKNKLGDKKAKSAQQSNEEMDADLNEMNDGNKIFEAQEEWRKEHTKLEEEALTQSAEGGR